MASKLLYYFNKPLLSPPKNKSPVSLSVPSLTPLHSMKCTESEDEEPAKGKESQLQLSCFINQEVKYLATGLRLVSSTTATHNHMHRNTDTCTARTHTVRSPMWSVTMATLI